MDPKYFRRIKFSFSHREKVSTYLPAYLWLKSDQNSRKGRLDNGPNYGSDRFHSVSSYAAHATTFLPIYHRHLFWGWDQKLEVKILGFIFEEKIWGAFGFFGISRQNRFQVECCSAAASASRGRRWQFEKNNLMWRVFFDLKLTVTNFPSQACTWIVNSKFYFSTS